MKTRRTITIEEETPNPPLDLQFVGCSCMLREEMALVCEAGWGADGFGNPVKRLLLFGMLNNRHRSASALNIVEDTEDFFPIERDTDESRQITKHVISESLIELGLIKETRDQINHNHPLIGVVCAYKGQAVLPFGIASRKSSDDEIDNGADREYTWLILLSLKGNREDPLMTTPEVMRESIGTKCRLVPIMKETIHSCRAYTNLIYAINKALDKKRYPRKPAEEEAKPLPTE
jgi:hypothetical protein